MNTVTLKDRLLKGWNGVLTAIGVVGGVLVEIGMYADLLPKDSRLHAVAVALGVLGAALTVPKAGPPVAPAVLLAFALGFALPARAQTATFDGAAFSADQPGGLLPQAGACFKNGGICIQPALTVVPILIDFKSGDVSRNIAFGFGYGIVFPRALTSSLVPGVDFLGGTKTGGGWIAAVMPRLGALRIGPVVSHNPGVTYAGLGIGTGM